MNNLIDRLKVTVTGQIQPTVVKATVAPSIKIPGATSASVAPLVDQVNGKAVKVGCARDNDLVSAGMRNKMAECQPNDGFGLNEAVLAKCREEYAQFLKDLENTDFSSMMFGQPTAQATAPATAPAAQEEVPLANGISVGEEAGGSIVIPTTTKKSRKKKVVTEEVQTDATETPAEVAEAPTEA